MKGLFDNLMHLFIRKIKWRIQLHAEVLYGLIHTLLDGHGSNKGWNALGKGYMEWSVLLSLYNVDNAAVCHVVGMSRELENLILENTELLATKWVDIGAVNRLVDWILKNNTQCISV